ncbi:MAG TPA: hypothetical protein PKC30_13815, partial [Saprospiraceae bacterium]|nr:hypothetical protein [Saprospiraceae bacterium]
MKDPISKRESLIVVFLIFVCFHFLYSQTTWTGAAMDSDWDNSGNWDMGVPGAMDDVIIPSGSTVNIMSGTNAVAQKVTITESILSVHTGASLTVDGEMSIGIAFDITGSWIANYASIMVLNSSSRGINLSYESTFTNFGTMNINNSSTDGLHFANFGSGSSFINYGELNFVNNGGEAIELRNISTFRNTVDGRINISLDADEEAIQIFTSGAHFINEGELLIHSAGKSGIDMEYGTSFTNEATGYILISNYGSIDRTINHAIENEGGIFINNGSIEVIGGQYSNIGIELDFLGSFPGIFINNGYLSIENIRGEGIDIRSICTFTNNLLINMGLRGSSEDHAVLLVRLGGNFLNAACGVLNMTSEDSISILMDGELTNNGVMTTIYTGEHNIEGIFTNNGEIA